MSDVVIVNGNDAEPVEAEAPVAALETATEGVEAVAAAQVEVAQIEADRDVTIAAITAETVIEQTNTAQDRRIVELEAEALAWRTKAEAADLRCIELMATLSTLETSTETRAPEPNLSEGEPVEATPVSLEEAEPAPAKEPVRREPPFRWI